MKHILLVAMGLCVLALFGARMGLLVEHEARTNLLYLAGDDRLVEGRVVNDPEERETSLHAVLQLQSGGKLLVILPRATELSYNDRVVVRGEVSAPENFITDTGREFDYEGYLRVRGISALMRYAELEEREEGQGNFFGTLYSIKHAFEDSIEHLFSEPQASLFEGIFLGERRGLPESLTTAFIVASLIHIVVLSGYNISIVGEAVLRGVSFLPRRTSFILGGVLMILFVALTGASSTSIRAGIMALIAILARYLHRSAAALRALIFAAFGMALWNPLILLYDSGFILSVVATFGLIAFGETIEQKITCLPAWKYFNLRSIAASTAAVQLYILPALLYFSGVLSLVALPANILVLPLVPLTMLAGFLSGLLGLMHPMLAYLPALVTDMLLRYLITVAEVAASLPLSAITVPTFPLWVVIAVYLPLTWVAIRAYRNAARPQTS